MKIALGFIGAFVLLLVFLFTSYSSAYNIGNDYESRIDKQYKSNQNQLSAMSNSAAEQLQITDIAKDQLVEVIKAGIGGAFGANGSQAMVQAFKLTFPGKLDTSMLKKVQTTIESNRVVFKVQQDKLIDVCTNYSRERGMLWRGIWLRIAGYPKRPDLEKVCQPVVSGYASDTFSSGKDAGMNFKKQ